MREPNATKLFVGQIPQDFGEEELKEIFKEFGDIHSLNLLQDRATGQHKGCAFLIYYDNESAKKAQAEVHESRTLPGARHPIQVKLAASETNVEDRTLYVGMLSKKLNENDIRDMFSQFGDIESLHTLKNPDGKPKGCAFIKFESRIQAHNAIKAMHNAETMEGCTYPIVVKLADTDKDKMAKKGMQQVGAPSVIPARGLHSIRSIPAGYPISNIQYPIQQQYYQQLLSQQMALPQIVAMNPSVMTTQTVPGALAAKIGVQHHLQQQPLVINQPLQSNQRSLLSIPPSNTPLQSNHQPLLPIPASNTGWLAGTLGTPVHSMSNLSMLGTGGVAVGGVDGYPAVGAGVLSNGSTRYSDATLQQAYYAGVQQYMASMTQSYNNVALHQTSGQPSSSKKDNSDGTNLFIYHLPSDFNDSDLLQSFLPFGSVVSAKVYIDKATGLSKCFGFVNYSRADSANAAIKAMNGMTVGSKRLKVQLKRPKEHDKPY